MNNYDMKCKIIEEELRSIWPEWHVDEYLGEDTSGIVFRIHRDMYGRRQDSALKVIEVYCDDVEKESTVILPFKRQEDPLIKDKNRGNTFEKLRRDMQAMESLRGAPNIVTIDDFYFKKDSSSACLFVRMELLTSLQQLLSESHEEQRLLSGYHEEQRILSGYHGEQRILSGYHGEQRFSSIREIVKIGKDICRALIYGEKYGLIFGNIKPSNLFADNFGNYKIGYFSVPKDTDSVQAVHGKNSSGTFDYMYMAPEIFQGKSFSNTVDIYALGLILYQMLNKSRMPFIPETGSYTVQDIESAVYKRLQGTPLPSLQGRSVGGELIDFELDSIVRRACDMQPGHRFQTAQSFYDALAAWETKNQELNVKAVNTEHKKKRPLIKKKYVAGLAILLLIAVSALFFQAGPGGIASSSSSSVTTDSSGSAYTGEMLVVEVDEYDPVQITDSWEEIIASGEDGSYIDKYHLKDTKELDLGEEGIIEMELVAFDSDELADGSGKAAMTWIAKDLLNSEHVLNEDKEKEGGWPESDLRTWMQEHVLPMFPETVRSNIKEVKKYSYSFSDKTTVTSADTIWIPSMREMVGPNPKYETEGTNYAKVFIDTASMKKTHIDSSEHSMWWFRTEYSRRDYSNSYKPSYYACHIEDDSYSIYKSLSQYDSAAVSIGFCTGAASTSSSMTSEEDDSAQVSVTDTGEENTASEEKDSSQGLLTYLREKIYGSRERDPAPGSLTDSWEEIIASGENGTYIDKYRIGDTKEIDLGQEGVIEMELVAFDADELADGSGKAPMTWIGKNLLNSTCAMYADYIDRIGSWPASDLRIWLHNTIFPTLPEPVRSNIKEVKKYSYSYYDDDTISSVDKIWIPSKREIYGENYCLEDKGPEYITAFPDGDARLKKNLDASEQLSYRWNNWWLRSASQFGSYECVSGEGMLEYNMSETNLSGIAIGFCF